MNKNRIEAFSDGVLAIIITIMVLEIKVPEGHDFESLKPLLPKFLSYVLSFIYIGIYWNNHHHLFQSFRKISGGIMWANTHLLFWLSLVPFATSWMGENGFSKPSLALYGFVLMMSGLSYWILQNAIMARQGRNSLLKKAIGTDLKGKSSPILYTSGIVLSFFNEWAAGAIYVGVALMWLIPDTRIEDEISQTED